LTALKCHEVSSNGISPAPATAFYELAARCVLGSLHGERLVKNIAQITG
jgi:hypothetical protein